jgi:hypothetical protein
MGPSLRSNSVFGLPVSAGARGLVLVFAFACTTATLDPSVVVGADDGDAGTGGAPLTTCELFTTETGEYMICPERLDYDTAAADCARRDATLVAVGSAEENDFIVVSAEAVVMGDLWLGGTRNDALVWSWPDGTVFWRGGPDGAPQDGVYVLWKPGEPNNASTTSPNQERCLAVTPADDWNDRACELGLPYICERSP